MRIKMSGVEICGDKALRQGGAIQIGWVLSQREQCRQMLRYDYPTHTKSRRKDLGKRTDVINTLTFKFSHRRLRRIVIIEKAVDIILNDRHTVTSRHFSKPHALIKTKAN